jgi:hypothetical protein
LLPCLGVIRRGKPVFGQQIMQLVLKTRDVRLISTTLSARSIRCRRRLNSCIIKWTRQVTFGCRTGGVITDLRVCDGESVTADDRVDYIVAEDKRSLVWLEYQEEVLMLLQNETVPVFPQRHAPR